jgi:hypothetical protein
MCTKSIALACIDAWSVLRLSLELCVPLYMMHLVIPSLKLKNLSPASVIRSVKEAFSSYETSLGKL